MFVGFGRLRVTPHEPSIHSVILRLNSIQKRKKQRPELMFSVRTYERLLPLVCLKAGHLIVDGG